MLNIGNWKKQQKESYLTTVMLLCSVDLIPLL